MKYLIAVITITILIVFAVDMGIFDGNTTTVLKKAGYTNIQTGFDDDDRGYIEGQCPGMDFKGEYFKAVSAKNVYTDGIVCTRLKRNIIVVMHEDKIPA